MLQYKIPQNVGIEDKIVGPFSLRQLIILAVGGGISYTLFAISSRLYELNVIEYVLIALPALFALAAAMLKIHNVTFTKYILLMLEFAIKPRKRMWDHRGISSLVQPDLREMTTKEKEKTPEKDRKNVNLSQLSAMLDSGGFEHVQPVKHEDIDKVNDDDLITEAYFGHKKQESSTQNMYWRTREVQKKKLDILAKIKAPAPVMAAIPTPTPAAAPPATKEARKETVTEQLAKMITETRKNNGTQNGAVAPEPRPTSPSPVAITPGTASEIPKKKRKRRKKPKKPTLPARQEVPINTMSETGKTPLPKAFATAASRPKNGNISAKTEKETSFTDLSKGGEIEFNLD